MHRDDADRDVRTFTSKRKQIPIRYIDSMLERAVMNNELYHLNNL
jgi:hypothetical protein